MRFYKLRIVQSASLLAANYNGMAEPEEAPMLDFEEDLSDETIVVGDKVSRYAWGLNRTIKA